MTIKGTINPHPDHVLVACDELPNSEWRQVYGPRCSPRPCRHTKHNVSGRLGTCGCDKAECVMPMTIDPTAIYSVDEMLNAGRGLFDVSRS